MRAKRGNGYFSGVSFDAGVGTLYRFRLDDDDALYPDPGSRFQPQGPSGSSRVVDPTAFAWTGAPAFHARFSTRLV